MPLYGHFFIYFIETVSITVQKKKKLVCSDECEVFNIETRTLLGVVKNNELHIAKSSYCVNDINQK
jgi:hypothetical protein